METESVVPELLPQQKVKVKKRGKARRKHPKVRGRPRDDRSRHRSARDDEYRPSIQETMRLIVITIRGSEAEKELWWMEAQRKGMSLSEFVRWTMNRGIGVVDVKKEVGEARAEKKQEAVLKKLCVRCQKIGKPSCPLCMI